MMCSVMWRLLCRTMTHGYLLQFFLLLLNLLQCAHGSGFFELQVLEMANPLGELSNGECCWRGPQSGRVPCNTFFRLCLKEYQSNVTSTGSCSFGNTSSPVLGRDCFSLADPERGKLVLPFTFRWTRSFTLILQAVDHSNYSLPVTNKVIEEATYSGIIDPSADWHTLNHRGARARLTYRVRVQCDSHYYNTTCTKFCRPRDDQFGHYRCDANGDKECISGWKGSEANCETAVCKSGCHPVHGKCDVPGECKCRPGWRGEFCDQCEPYPGCKHGYCNGSSWACICDTNWGGILCDQDLNYCGTHEPCLNGGTCENTAPDRYNCTCPDGFSGTNCEVVDNPCAPAPCLHGGSCRVVGGSFSCVCAPGWTGLTCNMDIDECASAPCQNGGTCVDGENSFGCECPAAWEGSVCQFDADECLMNPCINSVSCTNLVGDYRCKCRVGWTGKNCDQNINDCVGQCQHGATCIDLVNDYHCACQPGYTGRDCHTNIDDCASNPCKNGGECVDEVNGFRCICPVGFTGHECENDYDHCSQHPCENDASCFNTQADYYCHCSERWQGKNCSIPRLTCDNPPCEEVGGSRVSDPSMCGEHGHCIHQPGFGYRCTCHAGYTGKYCRENINDCKINPCENGGTCLDKVNDFQCICKEGWEGALCNINKDECEPNPCHNNGSCIDKIADFQCECRNGWKGKTCQLKDSHCDHSTCKNGGTCQDLGTTFACRCPTGWEGTTCHLPKRTACHSNPCLNGGTCVNTGEHYQCLCKDGFEGNHCQEDINDCIMQPCHNGGKCIDGVNWFLCQCADGFTGPDCRINVNECASNPCMNGGSCLDGIGDFSCLCPIGRRGKRCNLVDDIPYLPMPGSCTWQGHTLENNSTWQHECNTCICANGAVSCTKVWCGLGNCRNAPNTLCNMNQVCVPLSTESCLTPPCSPYGECRDLESGRRVKPPTVPAPSSCWPNQAVLSNTCARLTLFLDRPKLPDGLTVEGLCGDLRRVLAAKVASNDWQTELVLLCDLKSEYNDTVEVTLSGSRGVLDGIRIMGEHISRKQSPLKALTSILEVKVETALVSEEPPNNKYLIALVCLIIIGFCAAGCALFLYLRQRRRSLSMTGINLSPSSESCHRSHEDEKNNLQNEENLRRYANPLKEDVGSLASINSAGACALDLPKVSVVRPLSSLMPHEGSSEMLEMISEADCPGSRKTMLVVAGTSSENSLKIKELNDGLKPAHRNSQIMLYKAQNPDVRKNTAAFDDSSGHKDFSKSVINVNKQRTSASQQNTNSSASADVLTVLV
ncbi:PREDICTED: protein jagged-1b isoform X2 [Nicrophorus vespilloides]|uniref:Delta-like protein n=1 Tax=Nicrophorus vespilloides TaxID=110193 RepID=A0ABM1N165_NICVS|nr:PREDICTED: protein jagged-1b isoform X2 [Nicrophorus vespilloides]